MLQNVLSASGIGALARSRRKPKQFRTISKRDRGSYEDEGWKLDKRNAKSYRMSKEKPKSMLLEDRVWSLLYQLGYEYMSGAGGATLSLDKAGSVKNQIDAVALDEEVALAVECKCAETPRKEPRFQEFLAKHSEMRERFGQAVHQAFPAEKRRVPVLVMWTWDLQLTENDKERAAAQNVVLLDYNDLVYYEQLAEHLGDAAKYQFYSDLLPGRRVAGLERDIPALRSRMGKQTCYTFSVTPEYLLKIAYVARRAKGRAADIDAYQRMIKKGRLKEIREYIEKDGIFPTNIVISLRGKRGARFDKSSLVSTEGADYGTLHLTPCYGSAWIIDGQHRLYAFSGSTRAATSHLSVLAFVDLDIDTQTRLFMDINAEQKRVSRSLLQELYAELFWYEDDEEARLKAVLARSIKILHESSDSPFCSRVIFEGDRRSASRPTRCLTHNGLYDALHQRGLYIVKPGISYGPLWGRDNQATLERTVGIYKAWFSFVANGAPDWWNLGEAQGGGLAMNDSIVSLAMVLDRVLQHIAKKGSINLVTLSTEELIALVAPYGQKLGEILGAMKDDERKEYRSLRGVEGRTQRRRWCEIDLSEAFPDYAPEDLREQIEALQADTRGQAKPLTDNIESILFDLVVGLLKRDFGEQDDAWWWQVPEDVRKRAVQQYDTDRGSMGNKENYLNLLDLKKIVTKNWDLFGLWLGYGKGNKDSRTEWFDEVNDVRKIVAHTSKKMGVAPSQLHRIQELNEWLTKQASEYRSAPTAAVETA